jgi:D-alanyl-D-alanine carboxypeptidase
MSTKSPEEQLEEFRYDAKLFKQAYKAGIKAKKAEKEAKRKKQLKILGISITVILVTLLGIFIIRSPLFEKASYIKVNVQSNEFTNVKTGYHPSSFINTDLESTFIESKSALYADLNTGQIIYIKNPKEELPIASITKLMSSLVALKEFELNVEVEVQQDWYDKEDMGWSLGLDKGDIVTVETLLKAMLISSYNDAAYVLAEHMDGGVEAFVEKMNEHAEKLGLQNTNFSNPSGLDSNGGNISTVEDLYRLATVIYRSDFIMGTLTKSYADLEWDIGEDRIYTTNALMGQLGNIAGKTGYTELSGGCFLGITEDGKVTIVLGSESRFEDSEKLLSL